jgi:serine/threonine protein kinase
MDWNTRLKIAIGCARGLAFLHHQQPNVPGAPPGIGKPPPPPPLPLVHGNIKSSNVVLSADCEPLLSDFALAPLFKNGADNWVSSRVMAPGYTAPELQIDATATTTRPRLTQKADVYSFGVLLLEILTGKAPTMRSDHKGTPEGTDLPRWVQSVVREQWTSEVFDLELLRQENVEEEMVQTLRIAMGCVDPSPEKRPSMIEVVKMLEDVRPNEIHESHDTASHPMFYTGV